MKKQEISIETSISDLTPEIQLEIQMAGRITQPMRSHIRKKNHHRFKRNHKREYKEKERIKTANYQKTCDEFKRNWKKKGIGKALKVKGEKRPSFLPLNSPCAKSWTTIGYGKSHPLKHGMKIDCIWEIT